MTFDHTGLVEAFESHLSETNKSESTVTRYENNVRPYLDWVTDIAESNSALDNVFDVNSVTLEKYLMQMRSEGYAPQSIKVRRAAINSFYETCKKLVNDQTVPVLSGLDDATVEMINQNPVDDLDTTNIDLNGSKRDAEVGDGAPPHISSEEKEKLVDNVRWPTDRNALIIRLLWQTGLRAHELCNIRLDDIDRGSRRINIRSDKTGTTRKVWYQPSLDSLLNIWINVRRSGFKSAADSEHLFVSQKSGKLSVDQVNRVVKSAAKDAGIQSIEYQDQMGRDKHRIHAHTLRHSFAVQALRNDWNLEYIRRAMGHEDLDTTRVYLDALDEDLRNVFAEKGPGIE